MLPQLARPTGLLRLIGEARIEQKSRQTDPDADLSVSVEQSAWRKRKDHAKETARSRHRAAARKRARAIARSPRRGAFGLAKVIMDSGTQ